MKKISVIHAILFGVGLLICSLTTGDITKVSESDKGHILDFVVLHKVSKIPLPDVKIIIRGSGIKQTTVTDKKGRIEVKVPKTRPKYFQISASKEGFVTKRVIWHINIWPREQREIPARYSLELEPGTLMGGYIKNEKGEPVKGVKVSLSIPSRDTLESSLIPGYVITDQNGKWQSNGIPAEISELSLQLTHPDYSFEERSRLSHSPPIRKLRNQTAVTIIKKGPLLKGFKVEGQVFDENKIPLKDVPVSQGSSYGSPSITTDSEGRFSFDNCEPGTMLITVQMKGKAPALKKIVVTQDLESVDFYLKAPKKLRLQVVDSKGNPIEGMNVQPYKWRGYETLRYTLLERTLTDSTGRIEWDSAPSDEVEYKFFIPGFANAHETILADGQEHVVTFHGPLKVTGHVIDAHTGKKIKAFKVVPVIDWDGSGRLFIPRRKAFDVQDGQYEHSFRRADVFHLIRIEAKDYLPALSKTYQVGDGDQVFNFRLTPGKGIAGHVVTPEGKPLAEADVYLSTPSQSVYLNNNNNTRRDDTLSRRTGSDGRFSFGAQIEPYTLIAIHENGYALMTDSAFEKQPTLQIQAWSRIEGHLWQNNSPMAQQTIDLYPLRILNQQSPGIYERFSTTTDVNGAFVFEQVPPIKMSLSPSLTVWKESRLTSSQHIPLDLIPAQTMKLELGKVGNTILGRVVAKDKEKLNIDYNYSINYLLRKEAGIEVPESIKGKGFDWRNGWNESWTGSPEGRVYLNSLKYYFVKLNRDGTFRVDGVPKGNYDLYLRIYEPPGAGCLVNPAATKIIPINIDDRFSKNKSIDLGDIEVDIKRQLAVGDLAPSFSFETSKGKVSRLHDFKGKYILLDFWATWCSPCVADIPALKKTFETYSENENFVMISLSLDANKDAARAFTTRKNMNWIQGYLGDWSKSDVPSMYGVSWVPSLFLIGPDGKLIANSHRAFEIREAAKKALSTK